jgi:serine/threonine protein kinase
VAERGKGPGQAPQPSGRKRTRETAADRARIGSTIAHSYRIDDFLGRGAIGAVFGGMHLRLERRVAIKFVDPSLVDDPEIRARFKREAKICAQIGSSHVVEVFDYGVTDEGAPFLVMERLDGEDLHQRMLREGGIPVDRALRIAKQVCRALGAAHAHNIVHRDLKPENVFLLDRDGEAEFVKVVDFGLSTFVQSDDTRLTRAGQSVGTPLYMAPEQAGASTFDARVDVYSLGVLIFEMTTGRLPFEAATLQALLVALATQSPRSLRYYDPKLPQELDDLVLRFIARDPRVRPKTAAAALAEIVALEERLSSKQSRTVKVEKPSAQKSMTSGVRDRNDLALDGLPGKLATEFAQELHSHLSELRRTGSLSTSTSDDAPATQREPTPAGDATTDPIPDTVAASSTGTGPVPSSNDDRTRPMVRSEIDSALSDRAIPSAPRIEHPSPRPMQTTSSARMRRAEPSGPDSVEEDSKVFYGRVSLPADGSPKKIQISEVSSRAETSRRLVTNPSLPRSTRRKGPPVALVALALLAFVAVAIMIAMKAMRG